MFKKIEKKLKNVLKSELYAAAFRRPVAKDVVLYESFSGNGMLCNPEAIFKRLLERSDTKHLKHVWALNDFEEYHDVIKKYRHNANVRFVKYKSPSYFSALATSQYLINNATFPWEFSKRPRQTYVNTWHGTPLKKMGYDIDGGREDTRNIVRNFVQADYLLAANERMADMYLRAYKMKNIYKGVLFKAGYPRVDRQKLSTEEYDKYIKDLSEAGIALSQDKKVVLYAPTWKGKSFYSPEIDASRLVALARSLEARLGEGYQVILKVHQVVYKSSKNMPGTKGYLIPNKIPTNVVLGVSDILITDYSSVFFDYLSLERPVIFYLPDASDYSHYRGCYDSVSSLPGKVASNESELVEAVLNAGVGERAPSSEIYQKAKQAFAPYENGVATDRIIDQVFLGKEDPGVIREHKDGRESILIYLGGMASNGITASALNLLNNIDHKRFDVSAFYSYKRNKDCAANAAMINDNVRLFPRQGGLNLNVRFRLRYRKQLKEGVLSEHSFKDAPSAIWDPEWRRCFGASEFDYIVDFSGYAPFWDLILLRGRAKQHTIWLHNDLASDAQRNVNGKFTMKKHLEAVFSTYKDFDKLVSVSESLKEVNCRNLSHYANESKFVSARNTINWQRVKSLAEEQVDKDEACDEISGASLQDVVKQLVIKFGAEKVERQVDRFSTLEKYFPDYSERKYKTFVTVGRLSPEKNHERLIRAFSKVKESDPDVRLMIIGSGPLMNDLKAKASDLGVADSVIFTGQQRNPYLLMKHANCFVLSSDYEGQPMVILEARIIGLPIVTTSFGSVASALAKSEGLIVDRSVETLAEGMVAYLRGEVPVQPFDPEAYNKNAIKEFYQAIGAE